MALHTEPRTRAELLALPDDGCRHELVDGIHLVTPAPLPPHQFAQGRLLEVLLPHVVAHRLGRLLVAPADLAFGEDEVLQPDLFLLPPTSSMPDRWDSAPMPLLVIEIVSPGSARADRDTKRRRYQRAGVPVYWIVDPALRQVEIWHSHLDVGQVATDQLIWPLAIESPLVIDVARLFS